MANQWAAPNYVDGDLTTPQPCGLPVFSSPIPASTNEYIFRQEFMQLRASVGTTGTGAASSAAQTGTASYGNSQLGTQHPSSGKTPDYSAWVLVAEGEKQDAGAGLVKWTRTYAMLPQQHDEWESYAYNLIGTSPIGYGDAAAVVGRDRRTELVTSRVQHDYFYVNPAISADADPVYKNPGNIPVLRQFYYLKQFTVTVGMTTTQYGGMQCSADYVADTFVNSSAGWLMPTVPTLTDYKKQCNDASANGWNAKVSFQKLTTTPPLIIDLTGYKVYGDTYPTFGSATALYGQIAAETSRLQRWMGNIYVRTTRYVLAQ